MDRETEKAFDTTMNSMEWLMSSLRRDDKPDMEKSIRWLYGQLDALRDNLVNLPK